MAAGAGLAMQVVARAASRGAAVELPAEVAFQLQAGDLIFRIGRGWQSSVVRGMAHERQEKRGDPYSHVGMLIGSPAHWQVLHAVPAEMPGRADAVVRDDLDFFLGPERAHGVAIYRVTADAATRDAAVSHALARLGTPFRIVENDREGQYCTTLIWRAWQRAGVDLGAHFDHLDIPLAAGDYLMPHSLRTAPGLRLVFEARVGGEPDSRPGQRAD
jgi:cell wall-associated NlpC family hydrolase